jgi:hypothetical protein
MSVDLDIATATPLELDVDVVRYDIELTGVDPVDVGTNETVVALVFVPGAPGARGASGAAGGVVRTTAVPLSGHMIVTTNDAGDLLYADAAMLGDALRPLFMTTAAWGAHVAATVVANDVITEPSWNWTVGEPIYLGLDGLPTQTVPDTAVFTVIVADVISPTTIAFRPGAPIITR